MKKIVLVGTGMVGMSFAYASLNQNLCDELVLIDINKERAIGEAMDFNGMMNLNETGAFLWEKLENDTTKEELLKAMLDEYEVTEDIAKKDIDNFITKLKDGNLLE